MTQKIDHIWGNATSTTGAVSATVSDPTAADEIPSNSCSFYTAKVVCRNTSTNVGAGFTLTACIKNVAGTRSLSGVSTTSAVSGDATLAAVTGAITITGGVVTVSVTGVAAVTLSWTVLVSLLVD